MAKQYTLNIGFDDNKLLPLVFGEHDKFLSEIEKNLKISINNRGGELILHGEESIVNRAKDIIEFLYSKADKGDDISLSDVENAIRFSQDSGNLKDTTQASIITPRKTIYGRSRTQIKYIESMQDNTLCFGIGPAGTGKTYIAVAQAVSMLSSGAVDKIIITRPVVEAGESLGFLPGDLKEKVDPYLRPIYDALYEFMPGDIVNRKLENGEIEIAPLAYMRGRTLKNSFVVLDEAQNTTTMQMKMFLTRLGENSRMIVTGDVSQVDLPRAVKSGLRDAMEILVGIDNIAITKFSGKDVVRHSLVGKIVEAYENQEKEYQKRINKKSDEIDKDEK